MITGFYKTDIFGANVKAVCFLVGHDNTYVGGFHAHLSKNGYISDGFVSDIAMGDFAMISTQNSPKPIVAFKCIPTTPDVLTSNTTRDHLHSAAQKFVEMHDHSKLSTYEFGIVLPVSKSILFQPGSHPRDLLHALATTTGRFSVFMK